MERAGRTYLVVMRYEDDWIVGFRVTRDTHNSPWRVVESAFRQPLKSVGMNGNDIRELPLGELMARAKLLATEEVGDSSGSPEAGRRLPGELGAFASRGPKSDLDYARLARTYVNIVQSGNRNPSATLVTLTGYGTAGTWTNRIMEARKRGLLTAGRRGEAGGSLTSKAAELVSQLD